MAKYPMSTILFVLALLLCGSLNTITMKFAFTMYGTAEDGQQELFHKPWFATSVMFAAMSMALPFDKDMWRKSKPQIRIDSSPGGVKVPLIEPATNGKLSWGKKVRMVALPAAFDILATGLCNMGFVYIPASVWQLLRGAEMVFAALLAVFFLNRRLYAFHWAGIFLSSFGIIIVGYATVGGQEANGTEKSVGEAILGITLCLLGQIVQAAQVIAEEWLLVDVDLPGLQIIGFEGIWGFLIMVVTVFPALYFIPGSDSGHLENEEEAVQMIWSNHALMGMILLFSFSCCTYNMAGIAVTGALSAVHRVMIEAMRTSIVWVFGLTLHYFIDPSCRVGEVWTPYSWYEVAGFVVLLCGQVIYGALVKVPGLQYPLEAEPEVLASPGSVRNLASPLPPRSPVEL